VDPDVAKTGEPYAYTGDDPVNGVDPTGRLGCSTLGFLGLSSACHNTVKTVKHVTHDVVRVANEAGLDVKVAGRWAYHHPQIIALALAVAAIPATGGLSIALTAGAVTANATAAVQDALNDKWTSFGFDLLGVVGGGAQAFSDVSELVDTAQSANAYNNPARLLLNQDAVFQGVRSAMLQGTGLGISILGSGVSALLGGNLPGDR
jgi:hypothetical protein